MVNNVIMGVLGKKKLITGCLQGLVEMCKHFCGMSRGSARGREGESGEQVWENGEEVA